MTTDDLIAVLKDNPLDDTLRQEVMAHADELIDRLDELDHEVAVIVLENSHKPDKQTG